MLQYARPSGARVSSPATYYGWQTEYQRQYVWTGKLRAAPVKNLSYNRNYAMPEDIIKPKVAPEVPVIIENSDSDLQDGGSNELDSEDGEGSADQSVPQPDGESENNEVEQPSVTHPEAVFGPEPERKAKTEYYDRAVVVDGGTPLTNRGLETSAHKTGSNQKQPMLSYGIGNTNPAADENFMKTFNVRAPISQVYPHTDERTSRIREYEAYRLRGTNTPPVSAELPRPPTASQQAKPHPAQQGQQYSLSAQNKTDKKGTNLLSSQAFRKYRAAQTKARIAGNTYQTEYQREFQNPMTRVDQMRSVGTAAKLNVRAAGSGTAEPHPASSRQPEQPNRNDEQESEAEDESVVIVGRTGKDGKNYLRGGKPEFHRRKVVQLAAPLDIPEVDPVVRNTEQEHPYSSKKVASMELKGGRILKYYPDPPSTWNLAQDLLHRAQKRQAFNEMHDQY
ncbi:hypothetical protein HDU83_002342 [Entophlyctis luteolus]|nr:hypothetical protein HDU83_002342 [Entophlyctis luteolus]KAJ3388618.1 hypothetical protein HDU84_009624 [Entophlyctis sp. JEL0112]